MDAREQRGLIIAALCKLNKTNKDSWLVPSQSGQQLYQVDPKRQTCTCLDHKEAGFKCKHLFAVEITMKRECLPDGTVIETESVTLTKKTTYKQDWKSYNSAQCVEKERFQVLLKDLCQNLPDRARKGGRVAGSSMEAKARRCVSHCIRNPCLATGGDFKAVVYFVYVSRSIIMTEYHGNHCNAAAGGGLSK